MTTTRNGTTFLPLSLFLSSLNLIYAQQSAAHHISWPYPRSNPNRLNFQAPPPDVLNNETFRARNIPPYLCREYFKSRPRRPKRNPRSAWTAKRERERERERERVSSQSDNAVFRDYTPGLHARDNFDRRIGWYINDWPTRRFFLLASSRVISRNIVANQFASRRAAYLLNATERSFHIRVAACFSLKC